MATELASAYLTLIPSLQGATKQIESQLGSVDVSKSGRSMGGTLASGIGSGVAKAAGVITAAIGGIAVGGGISRALNIEQAQTKLAGLGHDAASVASIMESARDAVTGTKYGLDEAATVAAQMSATGIADGDDMTNVLKTVADTATIAGRSMGDVGTIFASVAARGKLQGDDMLQLMSSGIPVTQLLAKHLGLTTEEISKMVSAGQIDFQTFADAMEEGMGGAAQQSGNTFSGAMANVRAALSRVGAMFASPVLDSLRQVFVALIPVIDAVAAALKPFADALADKLQGVMPQVTGAITEFGLAIEKCTSGGKLDTLASALGGAGEKMGGISPLAGAAAAAFAALSSGGLASLLSEVPFLGGLLGNLGGSLSLLSGPIGIAIAAFLGLAATSPEVRDAFGGALLTVGDALGQLVEAIVPCVASIMEALMPAIDSICQAVAAVLPLVAGVLSGVITAVAGLIAIVTPILTAIATVVSDVITTIMNAVTAVANSLAPVIQPAMDLLQSIINTVLMAVNGDFEGVFSEGIPGIMDAAGTFVSAVMEGPMSDLGATIDQGVADALSFFDGIGDKIKGFFDGAASWLIDAGASIIGGLIDGIGSKINDVATTLGGLTADIPNWKGPADVDRKLLVGNGQLIIGGLVKGLEQSIPSVRSTLGVLTDEIGGYRADMAFDTSASRARSGGASVDRSGDTYIINGVTFNDQDMMNTSVYEFLVNLQRKAAMNRG